MHSGPVTESPGLESRSLLINEINFLKRGHGHHKKRPKLHRDRILLRQHQTGDPEKTHLSSDKPQRHYTETQPGHQLCNRNQAQESIIRVNNTPFQCK